MKKKISLSFQSAWVLSKRDDEKLPVEAFVDFVKSKVGAEVLDASLTDCSFVVSADDVPADWKGKVLSLVKEAFSLEDPTAVVECEISDYEEREAPEPAQEAEAAPEQAAKPAAQPQAEAAGAADGVAETVDKIHALIGAEEFKALADECVRIAPGLRKYNTVEAFTHRCYLFAIHEGNGLTTYLELFAELVDRLGLFSFSKTNRVAEEKLPPQGKEGGNPFASVYAHFQRYGTNPGKLICIDISEWMTKVSDKPFRDFLSALEDHAGENLIVFRVPFVEKEILNGLRKGLEDILFVRDVSFIPFDQYELTRYAEQALTARGFTMEEGAWEIFHTRITEEKSDGRFYGMNTVNKVLREMIYRKQLDNAFHDVDDTVIKKAEIAGLADSYGEQQKTGLELLDDFVGMEPIRARVEEIVAQIEMSAKNSELGSPCIHMRFVGNPGTGKTTVARVIGKILKEKGILRNGSFFEYSGRDFCGRYVGETAPKTAAMCRDAYGSVLFIDEAYSLYAGDGYSVADYGREAIDTLIAEMENHRSDLVVIMAGYTNEMNELMKANAGLESRMPYVIEFPNYTHEQLYEIFMRMVRRNFKMQEGFEEAVREYFETLPDEVIEARDFSNARFVRNLFERTWGKAVLRAQLNKEDASILTKEDFLLASAEKEFKKIMQKRNRTLGFL